MITNLSIIKFFFLIVLFNFSKVTALTPPVAEARPEIKIEKYQDVFAQIKKQNWVMAITLADDSNNKALSSYVRWLDITRPGSNHDFNYLSNFYFRHKHWPKKKIILEKVESSITKDTDIQSVLNWFKDNPPTTAKGAIDFLEFSLKSGNQKNKIKKIKDIWINQNLTYKQQVYFTKKYSRYWNQDDNWKRFNRLIYEGKNVSARRTLNRISGDLKKLGEARLALSRRSPNVSSLIQKVPQKYQNDPGLIYERMRWRRKAKLDTASDLLINPPSNIENVRNWWINSRIVIRRLINKKKYKKAYIILKNHSLPLNTQSGREAEWLAGWVSIFHLKNAEQSINHFEKVFTNSDDENVKAKAAFWLSRSYNKLNDKVNEKVWLNKAAQNKFSFYGQNASIKINTFKIIEDSNIKTVRPIGYDDLFGAIDIIIESKTNNEKTIVFFKKLFELSQSYENKNYVLEKAHSLEEKYVITALSRKLKKPSVRFSYPLIDNYIPAKYKNSPSTVALIHAISHQESNFRVKAYSSAGARGLMQLMPFTAKKVARDLKIKYYKAALTTNPKYNVILGTTYINEMLIKFENALPLALAAYNAGPSRVKIWLKRYGDPRKRTISYIDWIESIPISETRYYVKKVLANLRIYQKKYDLELYEAGIGKKIAMTY